MEPCWGLAGLGCGPMTRGDFGCDFNGPKMNQGAWGRKSVDKRGGGSGADARILVSKPKISQDFGLPEHCRCGQGDLQWLAWTSFHSTTH